jgi:glycosyltransferase involved in cell wall biosynthesis
VSAVRLLVAGDPNQYTGGYLYDARIARALSERGCVVETVGLAGRFPDADAVAARALEGALATCADGARVVIDGLALGALPDVLARHAHRLCVVALVHHPLADEWGISPALAERLRASERRALALVRHVIVTSPTTARHLAAAYDVDAVRISTVEPGVERPPVTARPPNPVPRMLCVATLVLRKGHAVLVDALAQLRDVPWHCEFIGGERDPACARAVRAAIASRGLEGRIDWRGEVAPQHLSAAYGRADVFVLPSWYEGYGMAVTEALSHGLPVVTTTGGALAETLPAGAGFSVPPGDAVALAQALRRVLTDAALRERLRRGAHAAIQTLPTWDGAGQRFFDVLQRLRAPRVSQVEP